MPNQIDLDQINAGNGKLTCQSCAHSVYYPTQRGGDLWCQTHKSIANDRCGDFSYDPGSDEWERE